MTPVNSPEAVIAGAVRNAGGSLFRREFHVSLSSKGDQINAGAGPDAKGRFRVAARGSMGRDGRKRRRARRLGRSVCLCQ
jgi:hypothetical protein